MSISIFDLFSIGVGPSSSHTVGPMRAANMFLTGLQEKNSINEVDRIQIELYGSLGLTGKGHGTDYAVLMGLEGEKPETIEPIISKSRFQRVKTEQRLQLAKKKTIIFQYDDDVIFNYKTYLPLHANGLQIRAYDAKGNELICREYYSVGGGFVVTADEMHQPTTTATSANIPYKFNSAAELLAHCYANKISIAELMLANELAWRTEKQVKQGLMSIWQIMSQCITNGTMQQGILPGGLNVKRRAPNLLKRMQNHRDKVNSGKLVREDMNWLSLYAIAVNEENAAGGRVVTAPTNGAAGIIPAVLQYHLKFNNANYQTDICTFLLTAAAIGILYKKGASISAAEVGCQGEVGVACSMAAAGYAAVLGATLEQVENAAEIGMEHHLGLTCDPIKGLVQIPCIERNAMGAVQAVNSANLALLGDGQHFVSLDNVIATMYATGKDMMNKYKETSQGGLAVNIPEC